MKRTSWNRRLLAILLLNLLASIPTVGLIAQTENPPFRVSIDSPKRVFAAGSGIRVDITVENYTDHVLFLSGNTGERGSGFVVQDVDGKYLDSLIDIPGAKRSGIGLGIGPHKRLNEAVNICRFFDLTKPGNYSIQVRKRDPKSGSLIGSNILKITILKD